MYLEAKSRDEKDVAYPVSPAEEDRMGMQDDEDACLIMQDVPYVDDYGETPLQNFVWTLLIETLMLTCYVVLIFLLFHLKYMIKINDMITIFVCIPKKCKPSKTVKMWLKNIDLLYLWRHHPMWGQASNNFLFLDHHSDEELWWSICLMIDCGECYFASPVSYQIKRYDYRYIIN